MMVANPLRTAATFLLGWCAGGCLIATVMYAWAREALADFRATTDPTMRILLGSAFDDARSDFWLALALGVLLPLALMATGFAIVSGVRAGRRSKPLPK